jgi:hypothetical protein
MTQAGVMQLLVGTKVKPSCLWGGDEGSALILDYVPWLLPYNWRKIMEKPQSGQPKVFGCSALSTIHFVDFLTEPPSVQLSAAHPTVHLQPNACTGSIHSPAVDQTTPLE